MWIDLGQKGVLEAEDEHDGVHEIETEPHINLEALGITKWKIYTGYDLKRGGYSG